MAQIRIVDADGYVFEDTAEMGKRMPKIYRDWKYAHGLFASQPWFPPLGHLHTPTGKNPKGAFGDGKNVGVEQPSKFDLVINLKTAKQIDVTISPAVLLQANRVIK